MANASASSSVQAAVVAASSIPIPQNQGLQFDWVLLHFLANMSLLKNSDNW